MAKGWRHRQIGSSEAFPAQIKYGDDVVTKAGKYFIVDEKQYPHRVLEVTEGTCATEATAADKAIAIPNYTLKAGDLFSVTFTKGNTADAPTLNINSAGAKQVRLGGARPTAANGAGVEPGGVVLYYYNGAYFHQLGATVCTKHNLTAAVDPTTSDYSSYTTGSMWFNHANGVIFVCKGVTGTTATWTPMAAGYGR